MTEQNTTDWRVRRLAFVNEWSDEVVDHAVSHVRGTIEEVRAAMQSAADDLNVAALRGGDDALADQGAKGLGFSSAREFEDYRRIYPMLSERFNATPALEAGNGYVVGVSSTEVVFADARQGLKFFDRAWLSSDVNVGDAVRVGRFRDAAVTRTGSEGPYEPGTKHTGRIPEIKYLLVSAIERQEMDFRPEVMTVSDHVAAAMDFSEPIEVTAFRFANSKKRDVDDDLLPVVSLRDGHHRTAAAIQTQRPYLPVDVSAINAKGEKLNALIAMSRTIEESLSLNALPEVGV